MGIFSSKREYYAYAASSSLFEEIDSTLRGEILKVTRAGSFTTSIADAVKMAIFTDVYARAKAMLRYASKPDGYIRGFPESNLTVLNIDSNDISDALTRAVGSYDSITSTYAGRGNEQFFLAQGLKAQYPSWPWDGGTPPRAWDENDSSWAVPIKNPDTGEYYEATSFDFTHLAGGVLPPPEMGYDDWYYVDWEAQFSGNYSVSFNYTDNNGDPQVYTHLANITIGEYIADNAPDYVQVKYVIDGETFYWAYEVGSNDDPVFEALIDADIRYGQYLPVAVLMQDKVWFNEDPDSQLAITTNKLLKKLGTSGDDIREEFEEQEAEDIANGESTPEGVDKWDFFVHFAVPIRTTVRGGLEYLFHYFKQLEAWQTFNYDHYREYLLGLSTAAQPVNEITIKEAGSTGYNVTYRWSYCYSVTKPGTWQVIEDDPAADGFGHPRDMKEGEYTSHLIQRTDEYANEAYYREQIEEIHGPGPIGDYDPNAEEENHDYVVITRQEKVPEGDPPEYTRVVMMAPGMEYKINTSESGDYRYRYAQPAIWEDETDPEYDPETEGNTFRFPIHAESLLEVSRMHREEALQAGLTATVFLVQVVKRKWYERSFFKWLIIIIAIIIIVYFWYNPYALSEATAAIAGALGVTGSAIAVYVIYATLVFAVGMVLTLAAGLIGGTWGQIFAIVAMVTMAYVGMAGQPGGFSWTGHQTSGFAQSMAFIANVNTLIAQPLFAVLNAYDSHQLEQEMEDFAAERKEKLQELKDAYDGFKDWPQGIDPMDIIVTFHNPGANERPNDFLARTTDTNPGMRALDMVLYWSDLCTVPPRPGETSIPQGVFVDLQRQLGAA